VDTGILLEEAASEISASSWVAVDTEADSLHHYSEKLSLVQVSIAHQDYVIDPLAGLNLQPFLEMLSEKKMIFQAADSDIRLFKKLYSFKPREVFDTMIAAQLLGYPKMGLVDLAERHCGLRLSKSEQKADWSKRPLEERLLVYAANDTHYLKPIRDAMEIELKELGRLEWHRQHCAKLLQTLDLLPTGADPKPQELQWQIKGSKDLKGTALTLLRELWRWRETMAQERDKPPFKVLNSEYLIQIAKWFESHPQEDIGQWKEAPRNVRGEHRETINRIIRNVSTLPAAEYQLPERTKFKKKWTDLESKYLASLKTAREKIALDLKIHASLIATNAILEALAVAKPKDQDAMRKLDLMLPWQIDVAGEAFLKVLSGTA
jgi:ribonuclease D